MNKRMLQRGSHHAILAIVIVVGLIGALGFVGYNSWKKQSAGAAGTSILGRDGANDFTSYNFPALPNVTMCTLDNSQYVVRTDAGMGALDIHYINQSTGNYDASMDGKVPANQSSTDYAYTVLTTPAGYDQIGFDMNGQNMNMNVSRYQPCTKKVVKCSVTASPSPVTGKDTVYTYVFESVNQDSIKDYKVWIQPQDVNYGSLGVDATEHKIQLVEGGENKFSFTFKTPNQKEFVSVRTGVVTNYIGADGCGNGFAVDTTQQATAVLATCSINVTPSPSVGATSEYKFIFGPVAADTVKAYTASVSGIRSDGTRKTLVSSAGTLTAGRLNTKSLKSASVESTVMGGRTVTKIFAAMEAKVVSGSKTICLKEFAVGRTSTTR